jgi:hypothetical protein
MNSRKFVEAIKHEVRDSAVEGAIENYSKPAGRAPRRELVETSGWYNSLDETGRMMVERIIRESVDEALFGLFCVLDGVRNIEDDEGRGELKLLWAKDDALVLLNDPKEEYLHDIFNEQSDQGS